MNKKITSLALALLLLPVLSFAQNITKAEKLYKAGKLREAAVELEKIYQKEKTESVKKLLVNVLVDLGTDLSFRQQYKDAAVAFGRAKELSPDDATITDLFETAKELAPYQKPTEKTKEKTIVKKTAPPITVTVNQKELVRKLQLLIRVFEKNAGQEIKIQKGTAKKLDKLIESQNKSGETIQEVITKTSRSFTQTITFYSIILGAAVLLALITIILIVRANLAKRNILLEQLKEAKEALATRQTKVPLVEGGEKFSDIEIIEAELSSEDTTEVSVAQNLLKPFLNDADINTKTRAIRALNKYNPAAARKLTLELSKSDDTEKKIAFCQLAPLIPPEEAVDKISKMMRDEAPVIKRECIRQLSEMLNSEIPQNLKEKIRKIIGQQNEEEWIIT